jgi:hypothetical protein
VNARIAAILVVLLLVLGGGALLTFQQERAQRASNVDTLGRTVLPGLQAADVRAIRLAETKATLTLRRSEAGWNIAERENFPADFERVREFVLKAISLKVGQSEPLGEKDRERLALNGPGKPGAGTLVEFLGAEDKPLARLLIGRKYFRAEPQDPAKAIGDGRFVLLPAQPGTVYIVSDPLIQATTRSAEWIDRRSFQVEKVKTLELSYPDGSGWRIERTADNSDWKLAGATPAEKIEVTKANSASYSLNLLELADIAPPGIAGSETGLDKPTRIAATTLDGLEYAIQVGKLEGDNYYVSFRPGGTLNKSRTPAPNEKPEDKERLDKEHAERIKQIEERAPREAVLARHVLLIPKTKLADTLVKRDELLAKPEEKK